jgi:two-component system sensor histidine kinase PilS (NtrC family)
MTPQQRRLLGYLAGRIAVLLLLLALGIVFQSRHGGFPLPLRWFFAATGCAFVFALLSALVVRARRAEQLCVRLQPAWDVVYATALVYLSGGALSPFATLYPLAIVGGAILLQRRGALVIATASSFAYGLLADLQFYGLLTPLNPFPLDEADRGALVLQLLFNLVAFYAVAVLSGYLAEELRRTGQRLEEAKAEVLDLERLQDAILQSLSSGLVALDASGREVFHNRAAEELLNRADLPLPAGAFLGGTFDLSAGDRREATFGGGTTVLGYSSSPLFDRDGRHQGSILIFQDLTRVKHLEEDLRRADRLAAVGRLAAGLAHEIRNPLASLSGSVEVLRESLSPGEDEARLFAIVLRETERLNRLVTNFLHYARPGRARQATFDLRALVEETGFFFAQGEGRHGFHLSCRIPDDLTLQGDRNQMEQLFLNLFRNSREASSGDITVEVEATRHSGGVAVTIRDDGPGMAPEVAARAFEPFFSSKEGGTGLGLATVHRIVENHEGSVELETGVQKGTTLCLRLPAQEPSPACGALGDRGDQPGRGTLSALP